jgi:hypothetical protein
MTAPVAHGDYVQHVRPHWLTVGDIEPLADGAVVPLLVFDRNWMDWSLDDSVNQRGVATDVANFLRRYGHARFTRRRGAPGRVGGTLQFDWDTKGVSRGELHVEYAPGCWYPLEGGRYRGMTLGRIATKQGIPVADIPVGYRGPALLTDVARTLPPIVWTDDDDDE